MSGSPEVAGGGTIPRAIFIGALIIVVTELLGMAGWIAPVPVALTWAVVAAGSLVWWRARRPAVEIDFGRMWSSLPGAPLLWGIVSIFLCLTFITGFFGAPNVWDGLTYHLPRVERWVEQGHLGFWPTSVDRQLWMAPWSGYAILQFRLLTGGDRLAFLPSWLAYLGCIVVTARVVRQLGGEERQAAFGAVLMASMPVAVLHASSVQTDLAAAFWVLCTAALSLEAWQRREAAGDWRHASWLAVAVALSVATKGTSWPAVLPWLALYGVAVVRAGGLKAAVRPMLIGPGVILVLNGAHFARNAALFGDPLGDAITRGFLRLTPWTINGALANLTANATLHLGAPWTAWNEWWTAAVVMLQRQVIGADPAILFPYFGGFSVHPYSSHESMAGNPIHFLIALVVVASLWPARRRLRGSPLLPWLAAGLAAVVLHGLLVRWQPFGARLQLASMVWLGVAAAVMFRERLQLGIAATVAILALHPLTSNALRPLGGGRSIITAPRGTQYFAERPFIQSSLDSVAARLGREDCTEVGLAAGYDAPEYLLRVASQVHQDQVRLQHLEPASPSARLATPSSWDRVCGLLVMTPPPGWQVPAMASEMRLAYVDEHVALFLGRLNGGAAEVSRP